MGMGTSVCLWNLPLQVWHFLILVEVLKPIGDLIKISKRTKMNKKSLPMLIRRRIRVAFTHEVEVSFGMRRYIILATNDKLLWPSFR